MPRIPRLPDKDPNEVVDYVVDWATRLGVDTIAGSTFSGVSGTVVIDSSSNTATTATVVLSAGTLGETCELLNRITTAGGRVFDQTMTVRIRKR